MNNQSMLLYPAQTREYKDFGFMRAHLSFKPHLAAERQSFGSLITIDDAILKPGATGFGLHQHKDVEVVTFVIQGEVRHIDPNEEQHTGTLKAKGVQIITAPGLASLIMKKIVRLVKSCMSYKFGSNQNNKD